MADVSNLKNDTYKNKDLDEIADIVIGHNSKYTFTIIDIIADIDAIYFAKNINSKDLGSLLNEYYTNVNSSIRKNLILKDLKASSNLNLDVLTKKIYDLMTGSLGFRYIELGGKLTLEKKAKSPTDDVIKATCKAFAKYILNEL